VEERDKTFDQCGLPGPDRPEQVKCPDMMSLQVPGIAVRKRIVCVVDILLKPDVDMVHINSFERTLFIPWAPKLSCNGTG
jgi:hypothetical protein